MSENLRLPGKYSAAMESGDGEAVYEFFAPDFHSHVTERVKPERVGTTFAATSNGGGKRRDPRSRT